MQSTYGKTLYIRFNISLNYIFTHFLSYLRYKISRLDNPIKLSNNYLARRTKTTMNLKGLLAKLMDF